MARPPDESSLPRLLGHVALALGTEPTGSQEGPVALLPPAAYLLACFLWGAVLAVRGGEPALVLTGLAAVTMHMSWAVGFLSRLIEVKAASLSLLRNGEA